jgi:hypothetical protein
MTPPWLDFRTVKTPEALAVGSLIRYRLPLARRRSGVKRDAEEIFEVRAKTMRRLFGL